MAMPTIFSNETKTSSKEMERKQQANGRQNVNSSSRWIGNKENKQLQEIQTNMKRKAMLQPPSS